ncbi:MAG: hypothetical protein D6798_03665, partial [Deltaproteobacteria bacterium]
MSAPSPRLRLRSALSGAALVSSLVLLDAAIRWPRALADTDLTPDPLLPGAALVLGLPLGLLLGAVHRHLVTAALAVLVIARGDDLPLQLLLVGLAGLLAETAWRRPLLGALPWLGLAGGALALGGGRAATAPPEPRPDIVLVVLDTVSAAATSLHGAAWPTTPALEALAAEGTWYRQAVSAAPWTVPSHAALFTGLLPQDSGCHHEHPHLPPGPPTLAERLAAAGYRTGAFSGNPWVGRFNGLTRGFEHQESWWERARAARAFTLLRLVPPLPGKGGPGVVQAALDWLESGDGRPSFVFVNILEAHSPFHEVPDAARFGAADPRRTGTRTHRVQEGGPGAVPGYPEPGEIDEVRRLYAAAIRAADDQLAALRAGLERSGRWPRTVLVATSDHGEAMGEHGFHGHMIGLHSETLHVPLVVRVPGEPPAIVAEPVALRRLHPTLLQLAGLVPDAPVLPVGDRPGRTDQPIVSEQLRPLQVLHDFQRSAADRHAAASSLGPLDARAVRVRWRDLALLRQAPADGGPVRWSLYDLAADPTEQHDILPAIADGAAAPSVVAAVAR